MLKPSRYNFLFEYQNKNLLYNSLTQACILVEPGEDWRDLKNILSSPHHQLNSSWRETLIEQKFLVESSLNEIGVVRERFDLGKKLKKSLVITVACTIQCNFRCTYCFEPHRNQYLSEENFSHLLKVIKARVQDTELIQITWFGGEPLLMAKQIENWSQKIISECNARQRRYLATIVTNGSLLNRANIERLKKSQIQGIQITIDGPKEIHDRSRPSAGGTGTYDKILKNLITHREQLKDFQLSIRVNVDKNNIGHTELLLEDLRKHRLHEFASIYFARVENSTAYCGDISSQCFSSKDFAPQLISLNQKKNEMGFSKETAPKPVFSFCGALNENSFVIDASGDLFKCWHDVGNKEKRYATIEEYQEKIFQLAEYQGYSHFTDQDCLDCGVLPLCQGNCPYYRIGELSNKQCTPLKFNLKEHLYQVYQSEIEGN